MHDDTYTANDKTIRAQVTQAIPVFLAFSIASCIQNIPATYSTSKTYHKVTEGMIQLYVLYRYKKCMSYNCGALQKTITNLWFVCMHVRMYIHTYSMYVNSVEDLVTSLLQKPG